MADFHDVLLALMQSGNLPTGDDTLPETPTETPSDDPRKGVRLDIVFEKKGRGGKKATIVAGFSDTMSDDELQELASTLKRRLGAGGSARGGEILIQGDRRSDLLKALTDLGWKARVI